MYGEKEDSHVTCEENKGEQNLIYFRWVVRSSMAVTA